MSALRLCGARVATGPDTSVRMDLTIEAGRICGSGPVDAEEMDLSGCLLLPGLINAHDHLELNLFPRLGTRIYSNAGDWAADVYRPEDSPVKEHRSIPKPVRLVWGAIKNLLSGVTTVAHHNAYDASVFENGFPVRVVKRYGWAHSLQFSGNLKHRFAETPVGFPFMVHAAEGTDSAARAEIQRLDELGLLGARTVLVHANAIGPEEVNLLQARGCSIVWCPGSNLATYGQTLNTETIRSGIPIALGTDSAMTAGVNLLDEIRIARDRCGLSAAEIYRMVTSQAASILHLLDGEGFIREAGVADLIAVKDEGQTPSEAIFHLHPQMVMVGGEIKLSSAQFPSGALHWIGIEEAGRFALDADIPKLRAAVQAEIGPDFRLAGKLVTA